MRIQHLMLDIVRKNIPLFNAMDILDPTRLVSARRIVPDKVKFIYDPSETQLLYPGMYFFISKEMTFDDMELLEIAVRDTLSLQMDDPETPQRIKVPHDLSRKLAKQDKSEVFNSFSFRRNQLFLENVKCLLVDPSALIKYTSINAPEYGECHSVLDTSKFLVLLVLLCSAFSSAKSISQEQIEHIDDVLNSAYANSSVALSFSKKKPTLHIGNIRVTNFSDFDTVDYIRAVVYSFFSPYTDFSDYLEFE